MTIDEKKAKVQAEANIAIDANDGFGLIAMATGTGKSKIGVDRIGELVRKNNFIYTKVLLVVPTEKLRDEGWRAEMAKWNYEAIWHSNVQRECYASLHNIESEDYDLVILDECHNITPNNAIFFNNNVVRSCIGLTATPPTDPIKIRLLANILKVPIIHHSSYKLEIVPTYKVSLDEAVEMGLVAPYEVTIVTMPLNNTDKYIVSGKPPKTFLQTEQQKYDYHTRCVNFGMNKFNIINRMRFIYTLKSKTQAAIKILEHVIPKDKRTLIFCGSKEQAKEVNPYWYFSKPSKPKKLELQSQYEQDLLGWKTNNSINFEDFANQKINRLSCVASLNEGVNLSNIDIIFIIQLNSNDKDLTQRMGRGLRLRPDYIGKIIILTIENTVDIEWTKKASLKLDDAKIKWITLDDLKTGKETINF